MRSPDNILWLTPGFAGDEKDTTAIPSLQLVAKHLHVHYPSIQLTIITFQYPFRRGSYSWNGVRVWSAGGKNGKLNRFLTWMRVFRKIRKVNKERRIDLIHAFWLTEATLIGKIFSMIFKIPLLATAMGQDVKPENHYLQLIGFFSVNLTLISDYQSSFLKNFKKLDILKVIPFGIDEVLYHNDKNIRTIDILGVGSLNRIKDYELFIRIIGDAVKVFPGIQCMIIGEGPERKHLESLIVSNGLEKNIELAGRLGYENVIDRMHRARILLHTSSFEGQGLVITEALAAGLIVVCLPVGIATTLKSKKVFTGKSQEELTGHIIRLLSEPTTDIKHEVHYTISVTCNDYNEIYNKLVNRL